MTDNNSVKKASEELKSILGENTLYALVNNAGTAGAAETCIQTNYYGV